MLTCWLNIGNMLNGYMLVKYSKHVKWLHFWHLSHLKTYYCSDTIQSSRLCGV